MKYLFQYPIIKKIKIIAHIVTEKSSMTFRRSTIFENSDR